MVHDAGATRRHILDAATTEFSRHGLAGARVDRIAAAAGCSKERLYAHVGDKSALFEAVLNASFASLGEAAASVRAETAEDFAVALFDHFVEHPENQRLLDWARLEEQYDWAASAPVLGDTRRAALRRLDELGAAPAGGAWSVDDVFALVLALATAWAHLPGGGEDGGAAGCGPGLPSVAHRRELVREAVRRLTR